MEKNFPKNLPNHLLESLKKNIKEESFLFSHSLGVASILEEMGADENTFFAGFLHHLPRPEEAVSALPEETQNDILDIVKKTQQLKIILSLKKDLSFEPINKWRKLFLDLQSEKLRGMLFAMTRDLRPIFVILAEKLDEMRNLDFFPLERQKTKCLESLKIFAPLAYGIGMGEMKGQLEDLAFPYLYPEEYQWLLEKIKKKYETRKNYLEKTKEDVRILLTKEGINPLDIHSRVKHYFSLYQKLLRHEMDIEKIYDLVALRIIVSTIEECYGVLGVIHKNWPPLPGRIKDYIGSPKTNGYRSLHTTVFCEENTVAEFQIKTPEMHKEAEYGAAAHLGYKEKIAEKTYRHQFYWLEQIRKWKEEIKDPKKLSQYLESELFKDQIFSFTPKGDIINLPKEATPVDFAYAVHSKIGDHCSGALINGKIAPLETPIKNGDVVEILTEKNKTPSSDWLKFAKTQKAKSKIKTFLEKAFGVSFSEPEKRFSLKEKVALIKEIFPFRKKPAPVYIAGESGIAFKFSKCCSPREGDEVVAFITKGEGASLHKVNCQNIKYIEKKWPMRIVNASWSPPEKN